MPFTQKLLRAGFCFSLTIPLLAHAQFFDSESSYTPPSYKKSSKKKTSDSAPALYPERHIRAEMRIRNHTGIDDYRIVPAAPTVTNNATSSDTKIKPLDIPDPSLPDSGSKESNSNSNTAAAIPAEKKSFSLSETDFLFHFPLENTPSFQSSLSMGLPMRSIVGEGSEIGGAHIELEGSLIENFGGSLEFAKNRSTKLKLFDPHQSFLINGFWKSDPVSQDGFRVLMKTGPFIKYHAKDNREGMDYGTHVGAKIGILAYIQNEEINGLRLSAESTVLRAEAIKAAGKDLSGAGYWGATVSFDYLFMDNLWGGVGFETALLHPEEKIYRMPAPAMPGLFGPAIHFSISAFAM